MKSRAIRGFCNANKRFSFQIGRCDWTRYEHWFWLNLINFEIKFRIMNQALNLDLIYVCNNLSIVPSIRGIDPMSVDLVWRDQTESSRFKQDRFESMPSRTRFDWSVRHRTLPRRSRDDLETTVRLWLNQKQTKLTNCKKSPLGGGHKRKRDKCGVVITAILWTNWKDRIAESHVPFMFLLASATVSKAPSPSHNPTSERWVTWERGVSFDASC